VLKAGNLFCLPSIRGGDSSKVSDDSPVLLFEMLLLDKNIRSEAIDTASVL
jgi:hypothetical protein